MGKSGKADTLKSGKRNTGAWERSGSPAGNQQPEGHYSPGGESGNMLLQRLRRNGQAFIG